MEGGTVHEAETAAPPAAGGTIGVAADDSNVVRRNPGSREEEFTFTSSSITDPHSSTVQMIETEEEGNLESGALLHATGGSAKFGSSQTIDHFLDDETEHQNLSPPRRAGAGEEKNTESASIGSAENLVLNRDMDGHSTAIGSDDLESNELDPLPPILSQVSVEALAIITAGSEQSAREGETEANEVDIRAREVSATSSIRILGGATEVIFIMRVVGYLSSAELCRLSRVSRFFSHITQAPSVWDALYRRDFLFDEIGSNDSSLNSNNNNIYRYPITHTIAGAGRGGSRGASSHTHYSNSHANSTIGPGTETTTAAPPRAAAAIGTRNSRNIAVGSRGNSHTINTDPEAGVGEDVGSEFGSGLGAMIRTSAAAAAGGGGSSVGGGGLVISGGNNNFPSSVASQQGSYASVVDGNRVVTKSMYALRYREMNDRVQRRKEEKLGFERDADHREWLTNVEKVLDIFLVRLLAPAGLSATLLSILLFCLREDGVIHVPNWTTGVPLLAFLVYVVVNIQLMKYVYERQHIAGSIFRGIWTESGAGLRTGGPLPRFYGPTLTESRPNMNAVLAVVGLAILQMVLVWVKISVVKSPESSIYGDFNDGLPWGVVFLPIWCLFVFFIVMRQALQLDGVAFTAVFIILWMPLFVFFVCLTVKLDGQEHDTSGRNIRIALILLPFWLLEGSTMLSSFFFLCIGIYKYRRGLLVRLDEYIAVFALTWIALLPAVVFQALLSARDDSQLAGAARGSRSYYAIAEYVTVFANTTVFDGNGTATGVITTNSTVPVIVSDIQESEYTVLAATLVVVPLLIVLGCLNAVASLSSCSRARQQQEAVDHSMRQLAGTRVILDF